MTLPVIAAVAGGAVLEATTGLVAKTFGKKRTPRKAKKAGARKTTRRKATTKRKTTRKKRTTAKSTRRKTTRRKTASTSSAINKSTGRLKRGFKYAKGGKIVRTKKK